MYLPSIVNAGLSISMGWELGMQYDPQLFLMGNKRKIEPDDLLAVQFPIY